MGNISFLRVLHMVSISLSSEGKRKSRVGRSYRSEWVQLGEVLGKGGRRGCVSSRNLSPFPCMLKSNRACALLGLRATLLRHFLKNFSAGITVNGYGTDSQKAKRTIYTVGFIIFFLQAKVATDKCLGPVTRARSYISTLLTATVFFISIFSVTLYNTEQLSISFSQLSDFSPHILAYIVFFPFIKILKYP